MPLWRNVLARFRFRTIETEIFLSTTHVRPGDVVRGAIRIRNITHRLIYLSEVALVLKTQYEHLPNRSFAELKKVHLPVDTTFEPHEIIEYPFEFLLEDSFPSTLGAPILIEVLIGNQHGYVIEHAPDKSLQVPASDSVTKVLSALESLGFHRFEVRNLEMHAETKAYPFIQRYSYLPEEEWSRRFDVLNVFFTETSEHIQMHTAAEHRHETSSAVERRFTLDELDGTIEDIGAKIAADLQTIRFNHSEEVSSSHE